MARKRNRSLIVERARLAQAQTNIEQAWAALFPTITAQGKYTHNDTRGEVLRSTDPMHRHAPASVLTLQPQEQLDGVVNLTHAAHRSGGLSRARGGEEQRARRPRPTSR